MTDRDDDNTIPVEAFLLLERLAHERGLTRISELGDLRPYGTKEWEEWLKQHPPTIRPVTDERR
jgi:hypothetical protein